MQNITLLGAKLYVTPKLCVLELGTLYYRIINFVLLATKLCSYKNLHQDKNFWALPENRTQRGVRQASNLERKEYDCRNSFELYLHQPGIRVEANMDADIKLGS